MSREPVTTWAELQTLDPEEVRQGYADGHDGDAEPGDNRSQAYWHGWRNGNNDRNGRSDDWQRLLIADMRRCGALGRRWRP